MLCMLYKLQVNYGVAQHIYLVSCQNHTQSLVNVKVSIWAKYSICLFDLQFYVPDKNYGHVKMVS